MIALTLFDVTFAISEKDAKQFARDIAVLLDGGGETALLVHKMSVKRTEGGLFRIWYNIRNKPHLEGLTAADVAAEAIKLTKTSLDPQAKVVAALTKHLRQADALF
ncbi:MAG: hypothetical protein JXR75_12370 [Rhodobacteraceae bacterium]|nr:hypothetical protein [Paracoccaceae bacterium]